MKNLFTALLLCITSLTQASHLVGGTIQVKWLGGTNYQVSVKIFRDCDPNDRQDGSSSVTNFDNTIYVALYEKGTDKQMQIIRLDLDPNAYRKLDYSGINCPIITTGCTDLTTYTTTISMPESKYANNTGYYLSWERCCRNKIINNIQSPAIAGIALYAEIPAARFHNSSPIYQNNPVTLMCTNTLFKYNLNFVDPDKHQLKYSLVTPLNGHLDDKNPSNPDQNSGTLMPFNSQPYKSIAWNPGFNAINAIKGTLPLSINSTTGEITCIPSNPGVYVAAILVEEYLNGIKIGEVRLELQFTVTNCTGNPPKTFLVTVDNQIIFPNDTVFVEIPDKICLNIRSEKGDGANGDSIYMNISTPIMDSLLSVKPIFPSLTSGTGIVTAQFCFQSTCEYMNMPLFPVFVEATDNSCPLNKKSGALFWIKVKNPSPPRIQILQENGLPFASDTIEVEALQKKCVQVLASAKDSMYLSIRCPLTSQLNHTLSPADSNKIGYKKIQTNFCFNNTCADKSGIFPVYVQAIGNCPGAGIHLDTFWVNIKPMPVVGSAVLLCMTLVDNKETHLYYGDSLFGKNPFFQYYKLYRITGNTTQAIDSSFNPNMRYFSDVNTPNYGSIKYQYFMVGVNLCGIEGPSSDTMGTFEQLKFIPDQQLLNFVTVQNNQSVYLQWKPSWEKDFAKYFLYKAKPNQPFSLIHTFENINDTQFLDKDVDVQSSAYCYYLVMQDTCDNFGPEGVHACTMLLSGSAAPFESNLHWSAYIGWQNSPLQYQVLRADPSTPQSKIAAISGVPFQYKDNKLNLDEGIFYYTIQADTLSTSTNTVIYSSFSNTINLHQSPEVYVPNAVTANGDGLNDIFKWVPVFLKDFNIRIYNRWGQEVFRTNSKTAFWDLKLNGNIVAEDVYLYQINYTGYDDTVGTKQGSFTILH